MREKLLAEVGKAVKKSGGAENIYELNLGSIKIQKFFPELQELIEECKYLEILVLAECELCSLKNMPRLDISVLDLRMNM